MSHGFDNQFENAKNILHNFSLWNTDIAKLLLFHAMANVYNLILASW